MSIEFQRAVLRELDQICGRFDAAAAKLEVRFEVAIGKIEERFDAAVTKLEDRDEARDSEVSDLKLQVGLLRQECRRNIKRDAGLVSVPTVLVSAIVALAQWLATPKPAPAAPAPLPIASEVSRGAH